jgi:predicted DNA-binding transcriptional regulator YafY
MINKMEMRKQIENAMVSKKMISITYTDAKHNPSVRTIEPYEIKNGKLFGYCRTRNAIRGFNLERISLIKETEMDYAPRYPVQIEGVIIHGGQVENHTKGGKKQ